VFSKVIDINSVFCLFQLLEPKLNKCWIFVTRAVIVYQIWYDNTTSRVTISCYHAQSV